MRDGAQGRKKLKASKSVRTFDISSFVSLKRQKEYSSLPSFSHTLAFCSNLDPSLYIMLIWQILHCLHFRPRNFETLAHTLLKTHSNPYDEVFSYFQLILFVLSVEYCCSPRS